MKLLFDHNLSPASVSALADLFPESQHVFKLGMGETPDHLIAAYAKQHGYVVVTKDADYLAHSRPPLEAKVVWVRLRNCRTRLVHELLRRYAIRIREFGDDSTKLLTLM